MADELYQEFKRLSFEAADRIFCWHNDRVNLRGWAVRRFGSGGGAGGAGTADVDVDDTRFGGAAEPAEVDLHGLHVPEALVRLEATLDLAAQASHARCS